MDVALTSTHIPIRLDLPVPRLELVHEAFVPGKQPYRNYLACWYYRLILRHLEGFAYALDIAQTFTDDTDPTKRGGINQPFRNGVQIRFDARLLGVPGYALAGALTEATGPADEAWYTELAARPLRLVEADDEGEDAAD